MPYVDIANANYGVTYRITYTQTPNISTNTSVVAITKIQIYSTKYTGLYYYDGTITINGTTVITMNSYYGTHRSTINYTNQWYNVAGDYGSTTITHDASGNATVTFALKTVKGGLYNSSTGEISTKWTVSGSTSAALTQIVPEPEEPDIPEVTTKGVVYIDNGTEFVAYQVFIDDGTTWKQYIPYIDTGTAWVECGQ